LIDIQILLQGQCIEYKADKLCKLPLQEISIERVNSCSKLWAGGCYSHPKNGQPRGEEETTNCLTDKMTMAIKIEKNDYNKIISYIFSSCVGDLVYAIRSVFLPVSETMAS